MALGTLKNTLEYLPDGALDVDSGARAPKAAVSRASALSGPRTPSGSQTPDARSPPAPPRQTQIAP
jgi:hypothetical protein